MESGTTSQVAPEEVVGLYHDTCHHKIYALSCEEFDALRDYAGGCCQICDIPETLTPRGRLCIDHMESYGGHVVRGLLCARCNTLMSQVDRREYPGRIPSRVYDYRHNAWFSRKINPRGMNVRYSDAKLWDRPVPWAYEPDDE